LVVEVPSLLDSTETATVRLTGSDGRPHRSLWGFGTVRSEWRMTAGRLEFRTLPPGSWTATVVTPDGRTWTGETVIGPEGETLLSLD
jgi:hypothetical protein